MKKGGIIGMKILCVGDSITSGTGSTQGNSYPDVLERYLKVHYEEVYIVNAGMPGYSTKEYWEYISNGHINSDDGCVNYDAVIIMLGTNDCRLDNWVETCDTMKYLENIYNYFVNYTTNKQVKIFLCTILPLISPMPKDILGGMHGWKQERVEKEINPGIKKLANDKGSCIIDVYSAFKELLVKGEELYDGIHPYNNGYCLIGNTIGKVLYDCMDK